MSSLEDDRAARPDSHGGLWQAVIATSASDLNEQVYVTITGFHPKLRWGPCRWMPRGASVTYPTRGDRAVVMFDDAKIPHIMLWWPV